MLLPHIPPLAAAARDAVVPGQILKLPVMGPACGWLLIAILNVADAEPQVLVNV
jgi:hypothetical protein